MADVCAFPGVRSDLPAAQQPQAEVVARLQELLRRAESGGIRSIAYCYVNEECAPCEGHVIPDAVSRDIDYTLGFAVSALFHRFFALQVDSSRNVAPPPDPA